MKKREVCRMLTWETYRQGTKVILTDDIYYSFGRLDGVAEDQKAPDNAKALFYAPYANDASGYILLNFKATPGTIAHEAWHAVQHMFDTLGIEPTNEIVAYHLEHLVDFIVKMQKRHR